VKSRNFCEKSFFEDTDVKRRTSNNLNRSSWKAITYAWAGVSVGVVSMISTNSSAQQIAFVDESFQMNSGNRAQFKTAQGTTRYMCYSTIEELVNIGPQLVEMGKERGIDYQEVRIVNVPKTISQVDAIINGVRGGKKVAPPSPKLKATLVQFRAELVRAARSCKVPLKVKTTKPPKPDDVFVPHPTPRASPVSTPPAPVATTPPLAPTLTVQERIDRGISAWRSPDLKFPKVNCTSCHAADAFDLAMFNYSEATLLRRAEPHVGKERGKLIADLVKATREKYKITNPPDPSTFRPFQPGGEVLEGTNSSERDFAFLKSLATTYKLRATSSNPVASLSEALMVRDQVLTLDPRTMKIGIPFNKWTEDSIRGGASSTIADWIPDVPIIPIVGKESEVKALQDAYVASPSDDNFWKMYTTFVNINEPALPQAQGLKEIAEAKFFSLLIAQHLYRRAYIEGGSVNNPMAPLAPVAAMDLVDTKKLVFSKSGTSNPFWTVADVARNYKSGSLCTSEDSLRCFNLPKEMWNSMVKDNSMVDQLTVIRNPWFWIGWLYDQGLQRTHGSSSTRTGEYMLENLFFEPEPVHPVRRAGRNQSPSITEGYFGHRAFFYMKKAITESFLPGAGRSETPDRINPSLGYYWGYGRDSESIEDLRKKGRVEHATALLNFQSNYFLTWLFLLKDELTRLKTLDSQKKPIVDVRARYNEALGRFSRYFTFVGGSFKQTADPLLSDISRLVSSLPGDK
jgi:hypothetical protein